MLKFYKEHPNFDQFTKFDNATGLLATLTEAELQKYLPNYAELVNKNKQWLQKKREEDFLFFLGETPETHTRFPRRIYFQITRYCNLHCPVCFLKADKMGLHVPFVAIAKMAEILGKHGLMEVRLTGGEPTAHPQFIDIIHKFQEEQVYVSVATNGVIEERTLRDLSIIKNIWIICSIDGNEETHNSCRSITFKRIIKNLHYIKERSPNFRLRLTTVLTKKNKDQMHEIVAIAKSVGAESITVIPLRPQVRDENIKKDMVDAKEFERVIQQLLEAQAKYGVKVTTTIETEYKDRIYADPVFRKKFSCAAGREGANLDYDARKKEFIVYGCAYSPATDLLADFKVRQPFLAGSFFVNEVDRFVDIWRDESAWSIFRDLSIKSEDCKRCSYYKTQRCVGSCPIQNVDFSSLTIEGKVLDQLRMQLQQTGEWYCYKKLFKPKNGSCEQL